MDPRIENLGFDQRDVEFLVHHAQEMFGADSFADEVQRYLNVWEEENDRSR